MRCPTLDQLPQPFPGKIGWPWTESSPHLPDLLPDGDSWPRVSIVTPSYNQGQFIEETIRSVLLQGYPNLEYIVIDGGSQDQSVEIIRKYEKFLTYWVSEPDKGQTDAIGNGWRRATGDIVAYVNSDDFYMPGAVGIAASGALKNKRVGLIHGNGLYVDSNSKITGNVPTKNANLQSLLFDIPLIQPSVFFTRAAVNATGGLNSSLYYVMDLDICLRIAAAFPLRYEPRTLSCIRVWAGQKTQEQRPERYYEEEVRVPKELAAKFPNRSALRRIADQSVAAQLFCGALACVALGRNEDARKFAASLAACDYWLPRLPVASAWLGLRDAGLLTKNRSLGDVERYLDNLKDLFDKTRCPQASRLVYRLRLRLRPYKAIQSQQPDEISIARRSLPALLLHDATWLLDARVIRHTIPGLLLNRTKGQSI